MEQVTEIGVIDGKGIGSRTIHSYGCVLMKCMDGYAILSINHKRTAFRKDEICIITSDMFLSIDNASEHFSARRLSVPEKIFNAVWYRIPNMSLWYFLVQYPVLRVSDSQSRAIDEWMNLMMWIAGNTEVKLHTKLFEDMVCGLFLSIDDNLASSGTYQRLAEVPQNASWAIIVRFFTLLYRHYKEKRGVEFYAEKMNISAGYLCKVTRRLYGVSPKILINEQLTEDIKFRLSHTNQSIKEIANALNFEDASYFCRFFRRQAGCSPQEYRNRKSY